MVLKSFLIIIVDHSSSKRACSNAALADYRATETVARVFGVRVDENNEFRLGSINIRDFSLRREGHPYTRAAATATCSRPMYIKL